MAWLEVSVMDSRREFVMLAGQEGANVSVLCRRYGISRKTGYKWLRRVARGEALTDRPRRPHVSPRRTAAAVEGRVVSLRREHPSWGGRKIARRLRDLGGGAVPAPSTITDILRRHGMLDGARAGGERAFRRFERACANELWQMDFKGHFALKRGRCHPLTVLDDHSRFNLCLAACGDERGETVQGWLTATFRRYGLPDWMLVDNGAPWGDGPQTPYTPLVVWLLRLGVGVSHSRPYHPQTLGKDERFHRTLKAELLNGLPFADLAHCQRAFDRWRTVYNCERPHEALELAVPARRYRASPRPLPDSLPAIEYAPDHHVRRVQQGGRISFQGRTFRLPKAFAGYPVGLAPTTTDGVWKVFFTAHRIVEIDLRDAATKTVTHVSEHL
jgi:transposase InsO family protein